MMELIERDWYKDWWNKPRGYDTLSPPPPQPQVPPPSGPEPPEKIHHRAIRTANFLAPFAALGVFFLPLAANQSLFSRLLGRVPTAQAAVQSAEEEVQNFYIILIELYGRMMDRFDFSPEWGLIVAWPLAALVGGWVSWCALYLFVHACLLPWPSGRR